jgi:hypothetical protein
MTNMDGKSEVSSSAVTGSEKIECAKRLSLGYLGSQKLALIIRLKSLALKFGLLKYFRWFVLHIRYRAFGGRKENVSRVTEPINLASSRHEVAIHFCAASCEATSGGGFELHNGAEPSCTQPSFKPQDSGSEKTQIESAPPALAKSESTSECRVVKFRSRASVALNSRQRSREIIDMHQDYACVLTVNFSHPYPDGFLCASMNELLKQLNRAIFGYRFRKRQKGQCLGGVCSTEVCMGMGRLDGCLHFHLLIRKFEKCDAKLSQDIFLTKVLKILESVKDNSGRSISDKSSVHLGEAWGPERWSNYFTKMSETYGAKAEGFIGLLDFEGIVGLDIPKDREKQRFSRSR